MSSWIKIVGSVIVKYSDGTHNQPTEDGWREVAYPALQWKLDATGRVIKKSRADLEAEAQLRVDGLAEDRQRVGAKIDSVLTAFNSGNPDPLRKLLTRIVLKTREIEDAL